MKTLKNKKKGQVFVELLLTLPLFLLFIFAIMEVGNLAHSTLIANHVTYELARVAAMSYGSYYPREAKGVGGYANHQPQARAVVNDYFINKYLKNKHKINEFKLVDMKTEGTGSPDKQSGDSESYDLVLTLEYRVALIFPGTRYFIGAVDDKGRVSIKAQVRMPIEKPRES